MTELEVIQQKLQELAIIAHANGLTIDFMVMALKRQCVVAALERNGWNQCQTAAELGKHRNTLYREIVNLGISRPHYRKPGLWHSRST